MAAGYQEPRRLDNQQPEVRDALEDLVREGAWQMLAAALEEEVTAFLGRRRYERGGDFRGYRNGAHTLWQVTVSVGAVEVRVPRVAAVPAAVAPDGFQSPIVQKDQRASATTQRLLVRLYLEGLATGDLEPVFRELVGETTALSPTAIVRLKQQWAAAYAAWRQRSLADHRYASVWAAGVYLDAGQEDERTALLCVLGARADGEKELLAIGLGYRESTARWADVLRDLRNRGLQAPRVAIGDGTLGLWAALGEVFPTTQHQRCWNHRVLNVQDRLPKRLQPVARLRLRAMAEASTQAECARLWDAYVAELRAAGQYPAADTALRDWDDFVTFYHFPTEHWVHLRTTNPLESVFAGVRLRTDAAKRMRQRETALYLVFKLMERLSQRWRCLNGGATLMQRVLAGDVFVDGVLQPPAAAPAA
jgi:transposase-like protein